MSDVAARRSPLQLIPGAGVLLSTCLLAGCIGELPKADYPCLVDSGRFDTYNEAYVFSPGGDKTSALERAQLAERECLTNRQ
jgi:hypothetical protein